MKFYIGVIDSCIGRASYGGTFDPFQGQLLGNNNNRQKENFVSLIPAAFTNGMKYMLDNLGGGSSDSNSNATAGSDGIYQFTVKDVAVAQYKDKAKAIIVVKILPLSEV